MDAPSLTVFAGPNGSGKSSLTRHLASAGYDFGDYINPDDIATALVGSYEERVRRAQTVADARRADAIAARRSFSFETVFSHPSKLDVLDLAHNAGFTVSLFFIATDDPVINVERVSTRVQTGGHDVPSDRVIARYHRVMELLTAMLERVDRAWIFDNSVRSTSQSSLSARLVASMARGGGKLIVTARYPLPDWTERYLIVPLREHPAAIVM